MKVAEKRQGLSPRTGRSPRRSVARPSTLRIAMISPEVVPFAKSGGLADMVGGLAAALQRMGHKVSVVIPAYRSALRGDLGREELGGVSLTAAVSDRKETATVLRSTMGEDISVFLVRADKYFDRDYLYATPEGDYPDNAERFVFFCRAALEILRQDPPQIIHCHDWQSAPAIVFLKNQPELYPELSSAKTVFTVHNLGYQGLFWYLDWHLLNLDRSLFNLHGLEFFGRINFLKGGGVWSDWITTVSPTYAEEIQTPEQGFGLEGLFRERAASLSGILNGVDYTSWNPETDPLIARNYGPKDLSGKMACKAELQRALGLPQDPDIPIFGMVSRLTSQKGLDLLEKASAELLRKRVQFVLLGTGEKAYEQSLQRLALRCPDKTAIRIGFDEALAHQIEAGADFFLMPSLYEPCGLNQIYSLRYGTIPVVRATGGLKDTVRDYNAKGRAGTGFVFSAYEPPALLDAVDRGIKIFQRKREWTALMKRAMAADFSWDRSAKAYGDLYQKLLL